MRMPEMCRWYVYRRTEWTSWISSRDALWSNSCSLHIDNKGTRCHGKNFLYHWKIYALIAIIIEHIWSFQLEKYKNAEFGRCPRVYCCGQPCLPVGQSDIPRQSRVNIYCPRCEDVYTPRSRYHESILFVQLCYYLMQHSLVQTICWISRFTSLLS